MVKHSRKLAAATALLLWQKCLEFRGEKSFHNIKYLLSYMHCSLTVLALILLYGGHCFSVRMIAWLARVELTTNFNLIESKMKAQIIVQWLYL